MKKKIEKASSSKNLAKLFLELGAQIYTMLNAVPDRDLYKPAMIDPLNQIGYAMNDLHRMLREKQKNVQAHKHHTAGEAAMKKSRISKERSNA